MSGFRLGSVLGFEIRIDYSWFIIVFLILWSFSAGVFPARYPGLEPGVYVLMGTVAAVLFFASLVAHEVAHSLVARRRGIEMKGITLFVFGGMAHTSREADTPEDELLIAGVGPVSSIGIGLLFGLIGWVGTWAGWPDPVTGVATYLAFLNLLLAGFNLLPGFPLDGGRLFRAAVWKITGDMTQATRWASNGGKALGYLLTGYGLLLVIWGALGSGLWLVFIGWFLRTAATASFQQHIVRDLMEGVTAGDIMTPDPATVPAGLSLQDLVDLRFLRERYQGYPVVDGEQIVGLVTLDHVRKAAGEKWRELEVRDVMAPPESLLVEPSTSLAQVLDRMTESGTDRVIVSEFGRLLGVISASDVTRRVLKEQVSAELAIR